MLLTYARSLRDLFQNLKWGLGRAYPLTVIFGALAAGLRLLIGPSYAPGVSVFALVLTYVLLGVAAGVLVGLFRPLTRGLFGSAIVGAMWGVCLGLVVFRPFGRWIAPDYIFMPLVTLGGALFGIQIRRASNHIQEKRGEQAR